MGVRVRRWISMHGLALNVAPDLSHFGLIVPCGLIGRQVTSMEMEMVAKGVLSDEAWSIDGVKRVLVNRLAAQLSLNR